MRVILSRGRDVGWGDFSRLVILIGMVSAQIQSVRIIRGADRRSRVMFGEGDSIAVAGGVR